MAFIPGCNRDRDNAASQAFTLEGVSTICVTVGSLTGVPVEVGGNICVGEGCTEAVGEGSENGVEVTVPDVVSVSVCDGGGSSVGGALVGDSFAVGVSVGKGGGVLVGGSGWGALTGIHNSRQINNNKRKMAPTNLNRSYLGARGDVSMLAP